MKKEQRGHSLIETLVVIGIISVLMALYLPTLVKVRRKAEEVVVKEGFHQEYIARVADGANSAGGSKTPTPDRGECRQAFRQSVVNGNFKLWVTELKYQVHNEGEFKAYWNTLINPAATEPLKYDAMGLIAKDENGVEYRLAALSTWSVASGTFPVGWEFISTDLSETSSGTLGANILYTDGHSEYMRYPSGYPMCPTVAILSHRFVAGG